MLGAVRALSWSRDAEFKIRSWVDQGLSPNWSPSTAFGSALAEPLQSLNFDKSGLLLRWEERRFKASARVGEVIYKSLSHMARRWLKAKVHEVEISGGKVRYWKTSMGRPETILFFHGFGDSMDGVYPLAHRMVDKFDWIVPDLPGFGQSFKRNDLPHNHDAYRIWLGELVDAAKMGPVHVVGNSLGGAFSIMLAQERPDLVKSLTLLNTAAVTDFKAISLYDELLAGKILFQIKTRTDFDAFWARIFEKGPYLPPLIRDYFLLEFQNNHEWYGYLVKQIFNEVTHRRDPRYKDLFLNQYLPKLKVPSLIIWGAEDRLFPQAFGERAHKLLRNSRFVVLDGIGHAPQVEAPALVAKHLNEFIASLKA